MLCESDSLSLSLEVLLLPCGFLADVEVPKNNRTNKYLENQSLYETFNMIDIILIS